MAVVLKMMLTRALALFRWKEVKRLMKTMRSKWSKMCLWMKPRPT